MSSIFEKLLFTFFSITFLSGTTILNGQAVESSAVLSDGTIVRLHRQYARRDGVPFEETLLTIDGSGETIPLGRRNVTQAHLESQVASIPLFRSFKSQEFELAEFQQTEFDTLSFNFSERLAELVENSFSKATAENPLQTDNLYKSIVELESATEKGAMGVLLPHQLNALVLKRALVQYKFNGNSSFSSEPLANAVKLSKKQKAEINAEVEKLREKIAELRRTAAEKSKALKSAELEKIKRILDHNQNIKFESWREN